MSISESLPLPSKQLGDKGDISRHCLKAPKHHPHFGLPHWWMRREKRNGFAKARDSYYSGQPLIVDDMFDKVELKLRVYGSPSVIKYPRCSLKRQSAYADAEEDHSMFMALSSIWTLLLLLGTSAFLVPSFYTLSLAFGDAFGARSLFSAAKSLDGITRVNHMVLIGLGYLIGYPVASASVGALQGLLTNNVVALKGSCPNCGEQVFAFVKTDKSIKAPHKAECHVCECPLEYRTKVEFLHSDILCNPFTDKMIDKHVQAPIPHLTHKINTLLQDTYLNENFKFITETKFRFGSLGENLQFYM
ncbi:hypothetical protein TRIUR3_00721 [Triticum urartu]|uniref:PGR5-like protein 1A, chloroplastic n=1 Tax=Triticum urartu TaxID=4572 RepID=M7ZPX3_TRIUA|nr:hypothetical protein TRIUR3_00721 [Triticum urartu]